MFDQVLEAVIALTQEYGLVPPAVTPEGEIVVAVRPAPASAVRYTCPRCGAQNRTEARFCKHCGADLTPQRLP